MVTTRIYIQTRARLILTYIVTIECTHVFYHSCVSETKVHFVRAFLRLIRAIQGDWKKFSLTELGTRVPLIIRAPWLPDSVGKRTSALVELVSSVAGESRLWRMAQKQL